VRQAGNSVILMFESESSHLMLTLERFNNQPIDVPPTTVWYMADVAEARGKQELWTRQYPQRLKTLREHAIIESAVSSNRIEGVTIDQTRVRSVVLGNQPLRDRNESEVRGYRDALKLIHERAAELPVSVETIRRLHSISRAEEPDGGRYREHAMDIVETYADGRRRVRFSAVDAGYVPIVMEKLVEQWHLSLRQRSVHPLLALAVMNLDFLCIHPFHDGNGRVSRLLWLLQCHQLGYEVGRYISLERLIEDAKDRYYETLEQSSGGWHQGNNDPWPYVNYSVYVLKSAYKELEKRVGSTGSPRGEKRSVILAAIDRAPGPFSASGLLADCPGVGLDFIRKTLARLKESGRVECIGRGRTAQWRKTAPRN
jgi:Fic family protein